ncbi:hypothetical protein F8279_08335 [Micromonospora sp. AMSO1212t]|uniref:hypothetical protein n=1 Tax=Micromonospora sp. AMSO1212t TaxID=2650565 RepID=UPI00124B9B73|nr:hypothetical protein [Micromonospora sp. AMSO1212t]KAB1908069.1 hypothetical protein F8279_08335 [Micromonospora sp. AMSO1212t]
MSVPRRVLLVSVLLLAGCSGPAAVPDTTPATVPDTTPATVPATTSATEPAVPAACAERLETGRLPDWADAGFSGDTRVRHVFGTRGDIVAILFAYPLVHARDDGANNKILWVARPETGRSDPARRTPLVITATRVGTDTPVVREVDGGPGPSIVDLPAAGCWRLRLDWSGRTDTMDLVYRPASR